MEAEEQRRQMSQHEEEGENEASLSLPCGRQKIKLEIFLYFFSSLGTNLRPVSQYLAEYRRRDHNHKWIWTNSYDVGYIELDQCKLRYWFAPIISTAKTDVCYIWKNQENFRTEALSYFNINLFTSDCKIAIHLRMVTGHGHVNDFAQNQWHKSQGYQQFPLVKTFWKKADKGENDPSKDSTHWHCNTQVLNSKLPRPCKLVHNLNQNS